VGVHNIVGQGGTWNPNGSPDLVMRIQMGVTFSAWGPLSASTTSIVTF